MYLLLKHEYKLCLATAAQKRDVLASHLADWFREEFDFPTASTFTKRHGSICDRTVVSLCHTLLRILQRLQGSIAIGEFVIGEQY